jgi:putative ABC transport system permease protein
MWHNHLKICLRYIRKYKLYSFINITGLSIGIALSILIFIFIADEFSFDQFHKKKESLYRMEARQYTYGEEKSIFDENGDGIWRFAWMPTPLGPAIADEIPDIVNFTRWETGEGIVVYGDKVFREDVNFVDPGFFNMFDFKLLRGDPATILTDKSQVVITKAFQGKYFRETDPVGETIQLDISGDVRSYMISGIIEDPPSNSSLAYNLLMRQENRPWYDESLNNWRSFNNPTFIELSPQTDILNFNKKLLVFENKYFEQEKKETREREALEEDVPVFELMLQPFTKIHQDSEVAWHKSSDPTYSYIIGGIGLLILLIASINYIILSLCNSSARAKEVGIRKVLGANPSKLTGQFWGESMILVFFALITGIFLAALLLEPFNAFTEKSLPLFSDHSLRIFIFLIFLGILIGLLAGGYPAIYLSGFHPAMVLKSGTSSKFNTVLIRGLVILQYSLSAFLIISSMVMYWQMQYVTTRDLGYNMDQVLVVPTFTGWTDEGEATVNRLDQALQGKSAILHVSGTSASFNRGWSRNGFEIDGEEHSAFTYRIQDDYLKTLGLELLEGRDFDPDRPSDINNAIIVNEALVNDLGWDQPVGERLYWCQDSSAHLVIGVVKNYHFRSLENEIEPVILYFNPEEGKISTILIKISPEDIPGTIGYIEKTWKLLHPNKPFEYSFLDDDVSRQYSNYQRWMKIMGVSTFLAIFIACLGLFGLSGINAVYRMKEISIRKVLGASVKQLFLLMNREVVLLALISFILAIPVSYFIMTRWLDSFEYKIGMDWPVFLISGTAGILVAVLAVSYHTLRVSLVNPAEILKDE